jgi:hypothetical protein
MLNPFKKKSRNKTYTPIVPSGLICHTEKGFFYVKGNKRFKFVSDKAMHSWSLPIVETKEIVMRDFVMSGLLGFRDGSLLKDISDGKIYLVSDSKRRHIVDPEVLEWINQKVIMVGEKEISVHSLGDKLNG